MLYPQNNQYRQFIDLSGFWDFRFDPGIQGIKQDWSSGFEDSRPIAVPASWNDQFEDDFFIDAEETRNGIIYTVLPVNNEFQMGPTIKFGLVGEYLYLAADEKAISSHLRKAKKT